MLLTGLGGVETGSVAWGTDPHCTLQKVRYDIRNFEVLSLNLDQVD